jgi:hypothetical protein
LQEIKILYKSVILLEIKNKSLLNVIRINKSSKRGWPGHVARMGKERNAYGFWLEDLKSKYHLEELGVDDSSIIQQILQKEDGPFIQQRESLPHPDESATWSCIESGSNQSTHVRYFYITFCCKF